MRDENFDPFIEEFGEATSREEVPASAIARWRGALPDQLLAYWEHEGWCGYANGLFWTVDPALYDEILADWLQGSGLLELDRFHVIARSGFGTLHLWGPKTGASVSIMCSTNTIVCAASDLKKTITDADQSIRDFFGHRWREDEDLKDAQRLPLFERARARLGDLSKSEMYGFEPALVLGGEVTLGSLGKVDLEVHLAILLGLAAPTMPFALMDIDNLRG